MFYLVSPHTQEELFDVGAAEKIWTGVCANGITAGNDKRHLEKAKSLPSPYTARAICLNAFSPREKRRGEKVICERDSRKRRQQCVFIYFIILFFFLNQGTIEHL